MIELLTPAEHDAITKAGELMGLLSNIAADGPARDDDLREVMFHVHGIQRAVLKNAAARAYPHQYRLLGGGPPREPLCCCGHVQLNHNEDRGNACVQPWCSCTAYTVEI